VRQLIFASGGFDMEASPLAALSPNEEITLRRIAFGIGGGSTLRREDVSRLTKLNLVVARGNAHIVTAQGESRIAQQHGAKRDPLGRKEADELARVLGIKL
jgi:hypothetical protein